MVFPFHEEKVWMRLSSSLRFGIFQWFHSCVDLQPPWNRWKILSASDTRMNLFFNIDNFQIHTDIQPYLIFSTSVATPLIRYNPVVSISRSIFFITFTKNFGSSLSCNTVESVNFGMLFNSFPNTGASLFLFLFFLNLKLHLDSGFLQVPDVNSFPLLLLF